MTMSDPLGDMLTRIRNGQRGAPGQRSPRRPRSMRANVLDVLQREGYIRGCHPRKRSGPASRSSGSS